MSALNRLHATYTDRVAFFVVYTAEELEAIRERLAQERKKSLRENE